MEYAVRRNRASCGRGEHVWAVPAFLPLLLQNAHRIRRQRQGAVGVLRLQRSFDDLSVDSGDLPLYPEVALGQINMVTPPTRAGGEQGLWLKPGMFFSVAESSQVKDACAEFINWFVNSEDAAASFRQQANEILQRNNSK